VASGTIKTDLIRTNQLAPFTIMQNNVNMVALAANNVDTNYPTLYLRFEDRETGINVRLSFSSSAFSFQKQVNGEWVNIRAI